MDIHVAIDAQTAAEDAADWVAAQVRNAVRRRGAASLALSGGSTPALMLAGLVQRDVPWGQVTVWQVDERVAPDGDPARNAGLLDVLPLRRAQVRLMPVTARHLSSAVRRYAAGLPERFDVVHLGMGDDGHTASWPPGDPVIDSPSAVALCGPYNGFVRMTLTPPVVNAARHRLVLAPGAAKAGPMRRWLLEDRLLPIQRVRRTATVVVIDAAAAAQLPAASPPT
ncbi:MAG TPA: 6-phosphogluconolactonase [Ilumatobacteraceae bacterium]|jgi:6-phosphogluconolactonase|nr:6-phosphogluconolactonase [Ilumatobacteraceae bacterium]HRC47253.1 6-phosphogluconolactonase [Ilumatobacteraceae bacterium]